MSKTEAALYVVIAAYTPTGSAAVLHRFHYRCRAEAEACCRNLLAARLYNRWCYMG